MHFHLQSKCMNCQAVRSFSTPIPNILVLASMCESCGWNDLVGWNDGEFCIPCRDLWKEDVKREHARWLDHHSRA